MFNIRILRFSLVFLVFLSSCTRRPPDSTNPDTFRFQPVGDNLQRAAETITEADVRARVNLIAADSMGGRDTPSPGLDMTATYIASEFEKMGLEAFGDGGGWYQQYGIRVSVIDPGRSSITVAAGDRSVRFETGSDASSLSRGAPRQASISLPVVVAGGEGEEPDALSAGRLKGKLLLWATQHGAEGGAESRDQRRRALQIAQVAGAEGVLMAVSDQTPISPDEGPITLISTGFSGPYLLTVRESRLRSDAPALAAALDEVRTGTGTKAIANPSWRATLETGFEQDEEQQVPNVVGLVRGQDPRLRNEYLVFTAHFDHVGSRCAREDETDRICNGADDNASGTAGLLELAEAFSQPGARPRRSVIFAAVSGEERGLLGSRFFAENPPVAVDSIVANLNMDHLGRNWRDSIVVIGGEHSDLGQLPPLVAGAHPELNMKPLPDQWPDQRIYFRSDHFNFAREGIPILFFTNGFHDDYHRVTDSADKIDAEKESRVVRYIFYIGHQIANQDERPRWDSDSYREIVRPERQTR